MTRSAFRPLVNRVRSTTKSALRKFGYELTKTADVSDPASFDGEFPVDFDDFTAGVVRTVSPYTMTPPERIFAMCEAVKYIVRANVPGDIVECGVWKGGSMMAAATTLLQSGDRSRDLYLYDTFEGMTKPTEEDVDFAGVSALDVWNQNRLNPFYAPARATVEVVKDALASTGYPAEQIHFVEGRVEDTIPGVAPSAIALLRLDTDWYESTRHELIHLFPRLSPCGVLIIDDYGHFRGSRKATDEYLGESGVGMLLSRVDYSCRVGVKSREPA